MGCGGFTPPGGLPFHAAFGATSPCLMRAAEGRGEPLAISARSHLRWCRHAQPGVT